MLAFVAALGSAMLRTGDGDTPDTPPRSVPIATPSGADASPSSLSSGRPTGDAALTVVPVPDPPVATPATPPATLTTALAGLQADPRPATPPSPPTADPTPESAASAGADGSTDAPTVSAAPRDRAPFPVLVLGQPPVRQLSADPSPTQAEPADRQPPPSTETATATPTPTPTEATEPQPRADTPEAVETARTYTVRAGDTLGDIARRTYGTATAWQRIARANPLVDPTRLKVGQPLRLPAAETRDAADAASPTDTADALPPPTPAITHTIRTGESLSTLASRYYGDSTLWRTIFRANRDRIGNNPDALRVGMSLTIPPKPPS